MSDTDRHAELVGLISRSQTRLLAYAFSLTANRQMAEDVVQSTNLVMWKKADTFEPGTNFIAWAFKIVRLQVLEHRQKVRRDKHVFDDELVDELARYAEQSRDIDDLSDRKAALAACVDQLPTSRQELLWLRYRDAMSLADVGRRIGRSTNATAVLMHRLRQLLMDCVQHKLAMSEGSP